MKKTTKSAVALGSEYSHQCRVISWARMMVLTGQEPRLALLHGDSSGVRVSIGAAVKMTRAGRIKGWPDLFLPVPMDRAMQNGYCGLFIELKKLEGGFVSREQKTLHSKLRYEGYCVEVCKGADAAIKVIKLYLGIQ